MQCPIDQAELVMTERQGIEIDYCSKCRGVWLDRGELDKIIERSSQFQDSNSESIAKVTPPREYQPPRSRESERRDDGDYRNRDSQPKNKREGFLGNLFDF